jgi:hypothetical protein
VFTRAHHVAKLLITFHVFCSVHFCDCQLKSLPSLIC